MHRPSTRSARLLLVALASAVLTLASLSALTSAEATGGGGSTSGSLVVLSVTDAGTGLAGAVQDAPFAAVVEARNQYGGPLVVNRDTLVTLVAVSGPGALGGTVTGTIARNTSRVTITGATYSAFANGVVLEARASGGTTLAPGRVTVNVARTAVRATATPRSNLSVTDPGCAAPTREVPVCGFLRLPNGANGTILMSVGSCGGIVSCFSGAGVVPGLVTASVSLKDANGAPLYTKAAPATFVVACDKSLCSNGGVPKFKVLVDVTDTGAFSVAPDCPAKGRLGADQTACLDTVQSKRDNAGDLYSVVLFDHDIRGSYP